MDDILKNILNTIYIAFFCYILATVALWLIKYLKLVLVVNKIPGPYSNYEILKLRFRNYKLFHSKAMLPFIGNAHQLKPGSGYFFKPFT
jgi:hypothetical protein